VITESSEDRLRFRRTADGRIELFVIDGKSRIRVFERVGEGRYEFRREGNDQDVLSIRIDEMEHGGFRADVATVKVGTGEVRFTPQRQGLAVVGTADLVLAHLFDEPSVTAGSPPPRDPRPSAPLLGADLTRNPTGTFPQFTQTPDGRVFAAAADVGLWTMEITGLETIRPLPGGKLIIRQSAR
jgi:hypothetical protein